MCLANDEHAYFTKRLEPRLFRQLFVLASIAAVSACSGDVSREYRVDTGIHPEVQDENVRYRTTYYFRVFDVCGADKLGWPFDDAIRDAAAVSTATKDLKARIEYYKERQEAQYGADIFAKKRLGRYEIRNDSLYRFRMTGKASALYKDVHFESGTLRAEQIDPFGTKIRSDAKGRSFSVSPASNQITPPTDGGDTCPTGQPARRGFQILGPEGFRTFDQDERLILAMTSNSKPLIGLLQEMTSRMQRARERPAKLLLPLAQERSRILDGQRLTATATLKLARTGAAERPAEDLAPQRFVEALRKAFNKGVKGATTSSKTDE